jgi:hypothetical protein
MNDTKLKKYLPKGWAKSLSEELQVSEQSVYRALRAADLKNHIYQSIVELALQNRQKEKQLAAQMETLM